MVPIDENRGFTDWLIRFLTGMSLVMMLALSGCDILGGGDCSQEMLNILRPSLPASATDVRDSCSMGFNPTYRVTFILPTADFTAFDQSESINNWQTEETTITGDFGNGVVSLDATIDISNPELYRVDYTATFVD